MTEEKTYPISFTLNGEIHHIEVSRSRTLLYLIRDVLGFTGTKYGCGTGDCGTCKVLVDGKPKNSCVMPAVKADGASIITIEGIQEAGRLSILQQAFIDAGAVQCGFCTPGMIITGTALLKENPDPSDEEIRKAYGNNLCRCTGYVNITAAVALAAQRMKKGKKETQQLKEIRNEE